MTHHAHETRIPEWTFGDRVRKVRRNAGVTQAEFAARLGVGAKAASAWESFDRTPREVVSIAKRIELAFGVPAAWMLGLEMAEAPRLGGQGGDSYAIADSNREPADYTFLADAA